MGTGLQVKFLSLLSQCFEWPSIQYLLNKFQAIFHTATIHLVILNHSKMKYLDMFVEGGCIYLQVVASFLGNVSELVLVESC